MCPAAKKTKVDLITGFLGAGKTTFILEYARELLKRGERLGIIENDFGAINVDLMLLHRVLGDRCRLEMVIGGDPDCHRRRLKTKLIAMGIDRYDRIIVEPSGVFDVEEFSDILYEEPLDHLLEFNNVITVVDGEMLAAEAYSESGRYLLAEQLTRAGRVLVTKGEQLGEDVTEHGLAYLNASLSEIGCSRQLRPEELVTRRRDNEEGSPGAIGGITAEDWNLLIGAGRTDHAYIKKRVVEDGTFTSLFFFHPELPDEPAEDVMRRIFADPDCKGLMRVKGFVRSGDDSEWLEINATREHTELRESPVGQPVLIAIGEGISEAVIGSYLRSYENEYRP